MLPIKTAASNLLLFFNFSMADKLNLHLKTSNSKIAILNLMELQNLHPDTQAVHGGYQANKHLQAIKPPIYQSSTFSFENADQGKAFFEANRNGDVADAYIYSRLDSPNLRFLEDKLRIWDGAEAALAFESGMAAISATMFALLKPGDCVLHTTPLYGGTETFFKQMLAPWGVSFFEAYPEDDVNSITKRLNEQNLFNKVSLIYIETPANPTNDLYAFKTFSQLASELPNAPVLVADNTYLGPLFQQPLKHGVDVVVYSATKYMGGHSDLIAGAAVGSHDLINRIKKIRNNLGNMAGPQTAWLLNRSLETLSLRMEKAAQNADILAKWLQNHPKIEKVSFMGLFQPNSREGILVQNQTLGNGSMISFWLVGGQEQAYQLLNHLRIIKLAVSLGSNESLAQHPFSMTHSGVPLAVRINQGITPNLIRLSVGIEQVSDLKLDLEQALAFV